MQKRNSLNACQVKHKGIRSALTDEQLRKLEAASYRQCFKAGEPIFVEGEKTTHSFIVVSGALKLTRLHLDGERHVIGLMFEHDLLCGAFKPHHACSAEAATDLVVCAMPLETILGLCEEAPKFERVLFRAALCELEASHDWMLLLRGCSAYQRVAGFLRLLAKRSQPGSDAGPEQEVRVRFTLPLSRAEIAGFLGITIETVSRQMTLMRKTAVIELPASHDNREVIVPNLAFLCAHAERDFSGGGRPPGAQSAFGSPAAGYPRGL